MRSRNETTRASAGSSSSRSARSRAAARKRARQSALKRSSAAAMLEGESAPYSTSSRTSASLKPPHSASSTIEISRCSCSHSTSSASAMRFLLREMAARIEVRRLRELLEELALAIVHHRGIHDLQDGVKVALPAARLGQLLLPEAQLPAGRGPRRNLEVDFAVERWHFDRRAERRFPWRERQVEIEVVPARSEERMRMQDDVEIKIAVAPAVQALATLRAQAQALAVGRALGNARLDRLRHVANAAVDRILGNVEVEVDLRATIRILARQVNPDLVIFARNRAI